MVRRAGREIIRPSSSQSTIAPVTPISEYAVLVLRFVGSFEYLPSLCNRRRESEMGSWAASVLHRKLRHCVKGGGGE
jgi:hypothetical protein